MNSLNKLDVGQFNKCLGGIVKNKKKWTYKIFEEAKIYFIGSYSWDAKEVGLCRLCNLFIKKG